MEWVQVGTFLLQPTRQNIPVVEIFVNLGKPTAGVLVYNSKQEHALLFRDDKMGIILDYLDPKTIKLLDQASEVAVCEMDEKTLQVRHYYRAALQRVTKKLDIQLTTKKVA